MKWGVWLVVLLKLSLHWGFSARGYGFFGDELYYLACADHLAFGYVDHPPFSIWLLSAWGSSPDDACWRNHQRIVLIPVIALPKKTAKPFNSKALGRAAHPG